MNTQTTCVFVRLARISGAPVCVRARCAVVSQCVFDIYSGPPRWSRCLWSQPPAPRHRPQPRSLLHKHAHTHGRTRALHLLPRGTDMVSLPVWPLDGGRQEKKRQEWRRRQDGEFVPQRHREQAAGPSYILRPAGCQGEAAIHKSA